MLDGGDYINASRIMVSIQKAVDYRQGLGDRCAYIATQGPQENTVDDFWRMVVQSRTRLILMLCQLVENDRPKCELYWPCKGETCTIDAARLTVTLAEEAVSPDNPYCIHRRFNLVISGDAPEAYTIDHLQYSDWPDYGRPEHLDALLHFMVEMDRVLQAHGSIAPIIVHCSAGVGRTGTLCAIDIARRQLLAHRITRTFDVVELVSTLRRQRLAMVQSLASRRIVCTTKVRQQEQYILVNHAIAELFKRHLAGGSSAVSSTNSDEHHYVNWTTESSVSFLRSPHLNQ